MMKMKDGKCKEFYYTKTIKGKIAETITSIILTVIASPFLFIFLAGHLSKKVCNQIAEIDDNLSKKYAKHLG